MAIALDASVDIGSVQGYKSTGDNMTTLTRREYMKGLAGLAASAYLPQEARTAKEAPIPERGIGRRIRHLSYSDLGGRPDSVACRG